MTNPPSNLVACPHCSGNRIDRRSDVSHAGPTDRCADCGASWPSKPGTITARQVRTARMRPMKSDFGKSLYAGK